MLVGEEGVMMRFGTRIERFVARLAMGGQAQAATARRANAGAPGDGAPLARVEDPLSGRAMEVLSTEPGRQMHTGNFLDGTNAGNGGGLYGMGDGYVVEPQAFPETPKRPMFGSARLSPGQTYRQVMVLRPAARK